MARGKLLEPRNELKVIKPRLALDSRILPQDVDSPDAERSPSSPGVAGPITPKSPTSGNAQTLGISFTGATLADASGFPPDSMGAAGPTQFLMVINGRVRTFNKNTGAADGVLDTTTDAFFNSVMTPPVSNNFTSDPRVRYDRLSGRWFVLMIDVPGMSGTSPNRVLIAVSDSGAITAGTGWTFFDFQQDLVSPTGDTGKFADYPTLGIDANALYIGVNIFGSRGKPSAFSNTSVFVVRKSSVLSAGPIVVTAFRGLIRKVQGINTGPYTPQGVDNFNPAATEGYVIGADVSLSGKLDLRRISNPAGTPSISGNFSITTASTADPITVPHLGNTGGSSGNLDGLDHRLLAAHIRNGRLWATQNIGVDNMGSPTGTITRNAVRWYELQGIATGQTPSVFQSGTLFQASSTNTTDQRHYWMGSIMVSGQGHAAMGFSVAGANEYANAGVAGRLAGDALGTLQTPVLYTASATAYNPPGDPGGTSGRRWGDFSYTCLDPSDDMTLWTIQEFCNAVNSYGVRVVKILAPPPAAPSSSSPPSVVVGANNVDVLVTGTSANGSGFFDPGLGFASRISAAVNGGGVTINSITYSDPTHITINITVASAAVGGARAITVTNPDGQTATSSSGILTVVGGSTSNSPPALATISDQPINELTLLTFSATATDPNGGTLTFSLDPGAPAGASINPTSGVFTWTPTEAQGPSTNSITVRVTDNGSPPLSDTRGFTVVVNEVNSPPVLSPISDQVAFVGIPLTVTNSATDLDIPANILTFSLDPGAPAGAVINSTNGLFTWTPATNQVPSTNTVTVRVADNGVPSLNDVKSFDIVVASPPIIESIVASDVSIVISWSAIAGKTYRVQFKSDLNDPTWSDLAGDVAASSGTATKTDPSVSDSQRFYRVILLP